MNENPVGICKCGLCFDVEYPKEYGKEIIGICKKCKTIVIEKGLFETKKEVN